MDQAGRAAQAGQPSIQRPEERGRYFAASRPGIDEATMVADGGYAQGA